MEKEIINGTNGGNNNGNNGGQPEKTKENALAKIQRGWHRFSTSKGGRWALRVGKAGLVGLGLKTAYDYGKKSVKPMMVYVTPAETEPETETPKPEEPAETEAAAQE